MGLPFIGETLQLMIPSYSPDLHPFIKKRVERYGPIFRTSLFGEQVVVTTDEEFNKYLVKEEGKSVEIWSGPLSEVFLPGEEGAQLLQPDLIKYFRNVALSHIGPDSIREKLLPQMEQICSQTCHKWSTQTSVEVVHSVATMVLELFGKYYFGYDPEKLSENERTSKYFATFLSDGLMTIPLDIPGTTYNTCKKDLKKVYKFLKNVMEERRKSPEKYGGDFIDQLNKEMRPQANLSEDQVIYIMIGVWIATFLTNSIVLALIFKFLADHPSVLEELRVEHEGILKNRDGSSSSNLTWHEYRSMEFTQHVINETLRFSPSFPGLLRKALKDIPINGYTIPAGCGMVIVTPILHMNPKVYKDPLTFNPWRWKDLDSFTVSKYFKPFGGGMRQCPGADISRAFLSTFIHVLVTKYRWTKVKGGTLVRNPMLGLRDGVHIKIWEKPETNNNDN
ncbi:hypothetical protein PIB30_097167 [Stylosanthes scabra]|uniref:Cytochrome P450 n=1 Tax=Stylosanthes scabra TaxID=79078 RepID=A0ABU6RWS3_9FABA|nr:hypothetical protein [Stylosanthes scabra]